MEVHCGFCSECLDDRDVKDDVVICWKCGWKQAAPVVKRNVDDDDEYDDWIVSFLNSVEYPMD